MIWPPPAPREKCRRLAGVSRKLQPSRRCHIGALHLAHHGGKSAMAKSVFHQRQDLLVIAPFRKQHGGWR
jgi:hypothetical protein